MRRRCGWWLVALALGAVIGGAVWPRAESPVRAGPPAEPAAIVGVDPHRILDTRLGIGTGGSTSPVAEGHTIDLQVAGVGPVPSDAVGVVLNLTGTGMTETTWVAAWPSGTPRQETSVLNLTPGIDAPNMVTARLGDGRLSLYNFAGSTHLVADVAGYLTTEGVAGPPGPAGSNGAAGPPGIAAVEVVEMMGSTATTSGSATATCPSGKSAIAGGGGANHTALRLYASRPEGTTSWTATFIRDAASGSAAFRVYVVCAFVDP